MKTTHPFTVLYFIDGDRHAIESLDIVERAVAQYPIDNMHAIVIDMGRLREKRDALLAWFERHPAFIYKYAETRDESEALRVAVGLAQTDCLIIDNLAHPHVPFYKHAIQLLKERSIDAVIGKSNQSHRSRPLKLAHKSIQRLLSLTFPVQHATLGAPVALRRTSFAPLFHRLRSHPMTWPLFIEDYAASEGLACASQLTDDVYQPFGWRRLLPAIPRTASDVSQHLLRKLLIGS